jgi:enoyl-CoA hydratase/carnithine racemase
MSDDERVIVTVTDGVADVRLARPDKRNALDPPMFRAIIAASAQVGADPSVRVVVLSGQGKGFCAGLDVSLFGAVSGERGDDGARVFEQLRAVAQQVVRVWTELPVPVIAAVHGVALGGGFQLALGADLRVVAPDAQLGVFEIRWGIVPDMCGTQLLPPLVGPDVALDLMMTGRTVTGEEAGRIGLATRVADDPYAAAHALAVELVGRNPHALRVMKDLVRTSRTLTLEEGLRRELDATAAVFGTANQREAVRANLEGRPPEFS